MIYEINKYFAIKSILPNTKGVIEASPQYMKELQQKRAKIFDELMLKHNVKDPHKALELEEKELAKKWNPSKEALEFLEQLNGKFQNKYIEFYYYNPMLNYFSIDDADCDVEIHKTFCESIELVQTTTRKIPMIITKAKNYPLIDIVNIKVVERKKDE